MTGMISDDCLILYRQNLKYFKPEKDTQYSYRKNNNAPAIPRDKNLPFTHLLGLEITAVVPEEFRAKP